MSINPLIKRIAESTSIRQVADIFRCGFEFEYQAFSGDGDYEIDHDALADAYRNEFSESDFADWCDGKRKHSFIYDLGKIADKLGISIETVAHKLDLGSDYEEAEADYHENWETNELDNNREAYVNCNSIQGILPEGIEYATDSSVRGGELRTIGANTPSEFIKSAKWIHQKRNDFEVDSKCSFHIHVSVAGIKHSYGKRFQAEMIGYLMRDEELLSSGKIHERIMDGTSYFKFHIGEGKYSAIHFHAQGTWEFRVFGNIKTEKEMTRSLLAAYRALRHAYRVKLGLSAPIFDAKYTNNDITMIMNDFASKPDSETMKLNLSQIKESDNDIMNRCA